MATSSLINLWPLRDRGAVETIVPQVSSLLSEVPASTELRVITNPASPSQVVMPGAPEVVVSPSFVVADVLVSMRTPPRSHLACPTAVDVPASSSAVVSAGLVDCSEVVPLPKADEVENDFIGALVDSFYNSLEQTISLVLKGSPVPFSKLKVVLSRGIDCIRDFEGYHQATALELLVDDFEKTVEEWRRLYRSDPASLAEGRLTHLVAQRREARLAAQEAAKAISLTWNPWEQGKQRLGVQLTLPPALFWMLKTRSGGPRR